MITFIFTRYAEKNFIKLEKSAQDLITDKLKLLKNHEYFAKNNKKLTALEPATHRIRVGRYRLLLKKVSDQEFYILKVGHRKNIYQ